LEKYLQQASKRDKNDRSSSYMRGECKQRREKSIGFFRKRKKSSEGESGSGVGSKIKGIFRRKPKE
jgi:hypothetical protein